MKVNYLITACSHRAGRDVNKLPAGKDVLKLHLQELLKTDLSQLSQVTLVRPMPLERGLYSKEYWSIQTELDELKKQCNVVELDVKDAWWSYSSWIQAILKYQNAFDYYILMEDDFYPAHKDFIKILIEQHQKNLPEGGYLGSFYYGEHMAVSNGIVNAKSAIEGLAKHSDYMTALAPGAQTLFGSILVGKNKMADYTKEYRTIRWANHVYELFHPESYAQTIDLLNPIEYLFDKNVKGLNPFIKEKALISDMPKQNIKEEVKTEEKTKKVRAKRKKK